MQNANTAKQFMLGSPQTGTVLAVPVRNHLYKLLVLCAVLSFAITNCQPAVADPTGNSFCKSYEIQDSNVRGRARALRFPDGRVITVVGHVHGSRQMMRLLPWLETTDLTKVPQKKLDQVLNLILKQSQKKFVGYSAERRQSEVNSFEKRTGFKVRDIVPVWKENQYPDSSALQDSAGDLQFLKTQVSSQLPPAFIGVETNQEGLESTIQRVLPVIRSLQKELDRRRVTRQSTWTSQKVEETLRSGSMGHVYFVATHPKPETLPKLIATEDSSQDESKTLNHGESQTARIAILDRQWASKNGGRSFKDVHPREYLRFAIKFRYLITDTVYAHFRTLSDFKKEVAELRGLAPAHLLNVVRDSEEFLLWHIRNLGQRDQASAQNLVKQGKSGIHFVGRVHLYGTVDALESMCRNELASRPTSARSNSQHFGLVTALILK